MVITVNMSIFWKDSNRDGRSRFVLSGKNIQQAGDAPSPLPLYSQPLQAQQGAKFFKGTKSLSPSKISNNSILEQVNVILFHELLSQPITARACCCFWGLITVDILWYSWYSFAFATTAQPISQLFTHHLSKWQYYSLQSQHLPAWHMASLTLITSTRAQLQEPSSSGTAILPQLHTSLAEEPETQEFLLYFQAYMCLKTRLLLSEGQTPGPWVVETAVPQIHLRQGRNACFQSASMATAFSTATGSPD